jgi:hypothetical protein
MNATDGEWFSASPGDYGEICKPCSRRSRPHVTSRRSEHSEGARPVPLRRRGFDEGWSSWGGRARVGLGSAAAWPLRRAQRPPVAMCTCMSLSRMDAERSTVGRCAVRSVSVVARGQIEKSLSCCSLTIRHHVWHHGSVSSTLLKREFERDFEWVAAAP